MRCLDHPPEDRVALIGIQARAPTPPEFVQQRRGRPQGLGDGAADEQAGNEFGRSQQPGPLEFAGEVQRCGGVKLDAVFDRGRGLGQVKVDAGQRRGMGLLVAVERRQGNRNGAEQGRIRVRHRGAFGRRRRRETQHGAPPQPATAAAGAPAGFDFVFGSNGVALPWMLAIMPGEASFSIGK
ncbi:hypothetical protein D9M69_508970 [compost metagenome]